MAAILIGYGLSELLALAVMHVLYVDFSWRWLRHYQADVASGIGASDGAEEVIHPYLGWVKNPQVAKPEQVFGMEVPVNELGFRDPSETLQRRSPDTFIVGVTGGSVAWQTSLAGHEALTEILSRHPSANGRLIRIVRLAQPAFKQPQQLLALTYVMALGGEFDAIVNLDGFNEVALTYVDNRDVGTAVHYPQGWHARLLNVRDPRQYADAAELLRLRGDRQRRAHDILNSPVRMSPLRNLIWWMRDQHTHAELNELAISVATDHDYRFSVNGPYTDFDNADDVDRAVCDLWYQSSLQMSRICRANAITYVHVLQPNQYDEGSKVLSEWEQQKCIDPNSEHGAAVRRYYDTLRALGQELGRQGVAFHDASQLFSDRTEDIYADPWCHYNEAGNVLLAKAIAERLVDQLPPPEAVMSE